MEKPALDTDFKGCKANSSRSLNTTKILSKGFKFMLISFEPPANWSAIFKNFWKQQLGEDFEKTWDVWQSKHTIDPCAPLSYCDFFKPKLDPSQFPYLVLFTDLKNIEKQQVVIYKFPDWDVESQYRLLNGMIESILQCCEQPKKKRLTCLENSLNSPTAHIITHYKYIGNKVKDHLKKHPTIVFRKTYHN